ncbi:MAG TPA: GYF domain-containing protein [Acidobacteriota bacterium]|nr:GYF domain-containing protein [Acidobacteriota bacterium]
MAWFYTVGSKQVGPVEWKQLLDLASEGRLQGEDLVWSEGMASWQAASSVTGLFTVPPLSQHLPAPPLPPPPLPAAAQQKKPEDDPALRMILPIGRSGWAIAAGYLGLFSILLVPAPFAIITGILAIKDIKQNPEKHGMGRAIFGIIMGSVVVLISAFSYLVRFFQ